ncbi:EamA family transporter [Flavobacterium caeni]|uniref:Chloramphenicol-sensitive protein RarD n=1 Tax=Flavobacterium caeni TaxID=490189 RepID=A0A1G5CR83_9FLAO|nr:EamA family transporter [Flavobacterium caeni]SCY04760.1 chloramphenicol-sensitive protein RarD [Flavobacterium caeni]
MPNKYFLSAITAFVMWGFFSLALKPLHDYPSLDILFYRVFYATVLLLLINAAFRKKALQSDYVVFTKLERKRRVKMLALTIGGGFLLVVNWFLFIYAINHVSLKSASFAYLICPIVTTVLANLILKEQLSRWQWLAVGMSFLSCVILGMESATDLAYSLVIAFTFAMYLITQRKNNQFDRFVILTVQMAIAALVILPFFPVYSGPLPTASVFWVSMNFIVIFFTIIPLFLNLYALKGMRSATVGILMYLNPMIHFMLAVFYFKERVDALEVTAYLLILASIVVFNEQFLFRRRTRVES